MLLLFKGLDGMTIPEMTILGNRVNKCCETNYIRCKHIAQHFNPAERSPMIPWGGAL